MIVVVGMDGARLGYTGVCELDQSRADRINPGQVGSSWKIGRGSEQASKQACERSVERRGE